MGHEFESSRPGMMVVAVRRVGNKSIRFDEQIIDQSWEVWLSESLKYSRDIRWEMSSRFEIQEGNLNFRR